MANPEFPTGFIREVDGQLAIVKAEAADLEAYAGGVESDIHSDIIRADGEVHGGGCGLLFWILVGLTMIVGLLIWAFR